MCSPRTGTGRGDIASSGSECCFLCSGVVLPGDSPTKAEGLTVHGGCYDRYVLLDLEPNAP
jgi:hypothetical protein